MALTRASHCSACLRKSSMFFMLSSSFEGLSGGSGGAGVDARPGVTEPVRRREPVVRDGGLLPSAGDEARTEPSPLRRNRFCAVPRLRLPGAEASRRGSPGLGGRICRWVGMRMMRGMSDFLVAGVRGRREPIGTGARVSSRLRATHPGRRRVEALVGHRRGCRRSAVWPSSAGYVCSRPSRNITALLANLARAVREIDKN